MAVRSRRPGDRDALGQEHRVDRVVVRQRHAGADGALDLARHPPEQRAQVHRPRVRMRGGVPVVRRRAHGLAERRGCVRSDEVAAMDAVLVRSVEVLAGREELNGRVRLGLRQRARVVGVPVVVPEQVDDLRVGDDATAGLHLAGDRRAGERRQEVSYGGDSDAVAPTGVVVEQVRPGPCGSVARERDRQRKDRKQSDKLAYSRHRGLPFV